MIMKPTVALALFGWPLASLLMFAVMRPRRAAIASMILGWLLLPIADFKVTGVPAYTKLAATAGGTLLGMAFFDLPFRPGWRDLPVVAWCLCPFASSVTNDLGVHDGITSVIYQTVTWGLPYFIGRVYCSDLTGARDLAAGIFLGGLLYMPLCLIEIRVSPQLHIWLYGFHQHSFAQSYRFGGWRPTVFMAHGLMVAFWMSMASLAGIWLWASGTIRSLFRVPILWFVVPLLATTILCKSMGALVLLASGLVVLFATRALPTRAFVVALALLVPLYLVLRVPNLWSGRQLTEASAMVDPGRASSLQFRLMNEDRLVVRATERPLFGWGEWGRARIRDEFGNDISITDGQWIIEFGNRGLVGLLGMVFTLLMPVAGVLRRLPASAWSTPGGAAPAALAVMTLLFLLDCIPNAMPNPIFLMAAGGLVYLRVAVRRPVRRAETRLENLEWSPQS